jgi:predicted O-methyltransferase YrrM
MPSLRNLRRKLHQWTTPESELLPCIATSPFGRSLNISDQHFEMKDVPGMISDESGKYLFTLAFGQSLAGDIVEIGSWQGKSTIYLANSVKQTRNGRVYAVDHFQGNIGKEIAYQVGREDLSDLEAGFRNNIRCKGVEECVELLSMPSIDAAEQLRTKGVSVRLLLIDGGHKYEEVKRDFDLFSPFVMDGGLIVFDDYSRQFPGVTDFVGERFLKGPNPFYCYQKTFVLKWQQR